MPQKGSNVQRIRIGSKAVEQAREERWSGATALPHLSQQWREGAAEMSALAFLDLVVLIQKDYEFDSIRKLNNKIDLVASTLKLCILETRNNTRHCRAEAIVYLLFCHIFVYILDT